MDSNESAKKRAELRERYEKLKASKEKQRRGHEFENLLGDLFGLEGLAPRLRFRPKGEEIDGSFVYNNRFFLFEAKWTKDPLPASSVSPLQSKVEGKLEGTLGLFISISGFTSNVEDALVRGKKLNTLLFDQSNLEACLASGGSFSEALNLRLRRAAEYGVIHVPASWNEEALANPVYGAGTTISAGLSKLELDRHMDHMLRKAKPQGVGQHFITYGARNAILLANALTSIQPTGRPVNVVLGSADDWARAKKVLQETKLSQAVKCSVVRMSRDGGIARILKEMAEPPSKGPLDHKFINPIAIPSKAESLFDSKTQKVNFHAEIVGARLGPAAKYAIGSIDKPFKVKPGI